MCSSDLIKSAAVNSVEAGKKNVSKPVKKNERYVVNNRNPENAGDSINLLDMKLSAPALAAAAVAGTAFIGGMIIWLSTK